MSNPSENRQVRLALKSAELIRGRAVARLVLALLILLLQTEASFAAPSDFNFGNTLYGVSGNVGIGVVSPTHRLTLANTSDDTGIAYAWVTYSSKRYKENISEIDDALAKVRQMRGVYYDSTPEHGGGHQIGFIAEEVGKVLPEVVTWEAGGENADAMDYTRISALNLQAIKEVDDKHTVAKRERDEHRKLIESLRAENRELELRLESIESALERVFARQ